MHRPGTIEDEGGLGSGFGISLAEFGFLLMVQSATGGRTAVDPSLLKSSKKIWIGARIP